VALGKGEAAMVFMNLASCPTVEPGKFVGGELTSLRLRFRDGVTAVATAYYTAQGLISYEDNRRRFHPSLWVHSPQLVSEIVALRASADSSRAAPPR
jgi:hypothetical protein